MKSILVVMSIASVLACTSCGSNKRPVDQPGETKTDSVTRPLSPQEGKPSSPIAGIISGYLELKNALAHDNGNDAAAAAKKIHTSLESGDTTGLTTEQKTGYLDLKDDIAEHVEHISVNGSNIAHQREHFSMLSQDVIDLVKLLGSPQTLYSDFCPMYNEKKGAPWLSETKEISNPYYGKQMPTCGEVKEEINPK